MTLAEIADELYGLPLDEFTAARNARAKEDAAVTSLQKPSAAAWAINRFARSSPEKLEQVFELGAQLRDAQGELDAKTMRSLGHQRRVMLSALAAEISTAASMRGEIEQTLQAAMADEDAAAAVASGRLVRTISSDGLDAADLEGAVAVPVTGSRPRRPARRSQSAAATTKAKAALDAAVATREEAGQRVRESEARIDEAGAREEDARQSLSSLEARIAEAKAAIREAETESRQLARDRRDATESLERAEAAVQRARERLE